MILSDRLRYINHLLSRLSKTLVKRNKRCIFDLIGKAASYAFGLVTTSELDKLKEIILSTVKTSQLNVQYCNSLASHVHSAFNEISRNRERLSQLTRSVSNITTIVNKLVHASNKAEEKLQHVTLLLRFEKFWTPWKLQLAC